MSDLPTYTYRLKLGRWVNPTGWVQLHVEQAERDILYVGSYGIYSEQIMGGLRSEKSERTFNTVIPSDGTIAGYLPAPKQAEPARDYTIMGTASDGTRVVIAECHHEDITPKDEHSFLSSYVREQTARKNAKPSKTLKFPFAKDLIIDGEKCGKCTEIQEFAKAYSFITYNGVFQCTKNDKIQSNGFEIRVTTTK